MRWVFILSLFRFVGGREGRGGFLVLGGFILFFVDDFFFGFKNRVFWFLAVIDCDLCDFFFSLCGIVRGVVFLYFCVSFGVFVLFRRYVGIRERE